MKINVDERHIELTRRNLLTLLAKLNGSPPESACEIVKASEDDGFFWTIKAVEDEVHYADRRPGAMHPDTEAVLSAYQDVIHP